MTGTGQTRGRDIPRLLALCAVLVGLFLMHGAPATAAGGCHGEMTLPGPMPVPTTVAMASLTSPAMAQGAQQAADTAATHDDSCCSTLAPDSIPLSIGGMGAVLTILAATIHSGWPWALGRNRRRGPPPGGRGLLLQVCIART
ncbi:hypothetical protein ACIBAH_35375 [Streptomyces sp. NPDC051445]|uniref:hypothetical protein n=1 Tax=Streptomyces sp. NPDC051445 TaxID=3365653 RepID=UPI0037AECC2F